MNSSEKELKLEYETAAFLNSLFANEARELRYLEEKLSVRAVTRDGWILFAGPEQGVDQAAAVFADLEQARRQGAMITPRDFRMAVDLAAEGGGAGVAELSGVRLLGVKGRKAVTPKTPKQLEYLRAIATHDVTFGLGPAGTGKTYLAMAMALSMLREKRVAKIVLTRPAVEAGEALGFLPGDLKEKVAPYLRPLYDAIHDMIGAEAGERYLEDGTIEIAPLAFMRGRTLARSFVILDEGQNTTREQMFMALTRLGEESRMVVTGDGSQVDLKPNVPSGLFEAERALGGVEGIGFIRFSGADVVRHPVVGRIIEAYGQLRSNAAGK
jgi:phosphate starvation-inducible PhoH-like protein